MSMITLRKKIIVAIDGYSSCGKSSFAKLLAHELNYLYLDSGAMYRTVTLFAMRSGWINEKFINANILIANLNRMNISFNMNNGDYQTYLNDEMVENEIRGIEVSAIVSEISKIPEIRKHLVQLQQKMGKEKGIVMDGRDIGSVVFPKAEIKIFMTARASVRAQRRFDELRIKGMHANLDEIAKNIGVRDDLDVHRKISPLVQAKDAVVLDNSNMTFEEQMEWFRHLLKQKNLIREDD
jgi:cytidylate kinase